MKASGAVLVNVPLPGPGDRTRKCSVDLESLGSARIAAATSSTGRRVSRSDSALRGAITRASAGRPQRFRRANSVESVGCPFIEDGRSHENTFNAESSLWRERLRRLFGRVLSAAVRIRRPQLLSVIAQGNAGTRRIVESGHSGKPSRFRRLLTTGLCSVNRIAARSAEWKAARMGAAIDWRSITFTGRSAFEACSAIVATRPLGSFATMVSC